MDALFDSNGNLCVSDARHDNRGAFEGFSICTPNGTQFGRSDLDNTSWSVEGILASDYDGPLNFLLGGIYAKSNLGQNSYYVNAFPIDYITGVLGSFTSLGSILDANPANDLRSEERREGKECVITCRTRGMP